MIHTIKITKLKQIKGPKFKLFLGGYMHFCISSFISPDQIFNITFHEKTRPNKQVLTIQRLG